MRRSFHAPRYAVLVELPSGTQRLLGVANSEAEAGEVIEYYAREDVPREDVFIVPALDFEEAAAPRWVPLARLH